MLHAIVARERRSHCLDDQVGGKEAEFIRVIAQEYYSDIYNFPLGYVWRNAEQRMTRINHTADVTGAEIVGRGYAMSHEVISGCQTVCLDESDHRNSEDGSENKTRSPFE